MTKTLYKVENGVIVNAIVAEDTFTSEEYIEIEGGAYIGDEYDEATDSWIKPAAEMVKDVRHMRYQILAGIVDPIVMNVLRWNSLSAEVQQQWADYRQALLDITDQDGYPYNVVWPTPPGSE